MAVWPPRDCHITGLNGKIAGKHPCPQILSKFRMLSQIESLRNQRIIGLSNAIILCKSWQGGYCLAVWKTINAYLVSSFWAFSLASLQPILLTVATENIFLLLSLSFSEDYIQTQCGHGLSCPWQALDLRGPSLFFIKCIKIYLYHSQM